MNKVLVSIVAILCSVAYAVPAAAVRFTQGVISAPSTQFYFDYTLDPTPSLFKTGSSFDISTDVCDYNTATGFECSKDTLTFYSDAAGGGFSRLHGYLATETDAGRYLGSQMYGGAEDAPRFIPGGYVVSTNAGEGFFTVGSAVPETKTWAMLLLGFGVVGTSLRRRRQRISTFSLDGPR